MAGAQPVQHDAAGLVHAERVLEQLNEFRGAKAGRQGSQGGGEDCQRERALLVAPAMPATRPVARGSSGRVSPISIADNPPAR
jgi:hypothetical protein